MFILPLSPVTIIWSTLQAETQLHLQLRFHKKNTKITNMSINNQSGDASRFSNTDDNRKKIKRSYNDQAYGEQDRPGKKQDSEAQDYERPAEIMIVLLYASNKQHNA